MTADFLGDKLPIFTNNGSLTGCRNLTRSILYRATVLEDPAESLNAYNQVHSNASREHLY